MTTKFYRFIGASCLIIYAGGAAAKIEADAFRSFGAQENQYGFMYGSYDGSTFSPFSARSPCFDARTICLRSAAVPLGLEVDKSTVGAFTTHGLKVPADGLLLLGGRSTEAMYLAYTAPSRATFNSSASFDLLNTTPAAVELSFFYRPVSGPVVVSKIGTLDNTVNGIGVSMLLDVQPGDVFGYLVGGDSYGTDPAVGVNFVVSDTVAGIPEPSTWALWLAGVGILGMTFRNNRKQASLAKPMRSDRPKGARTATVGDTVFTNA